MKKNGRRRPRKIPEVLDENERQKLLSQLEPTDTLLRLRNRTILAVLLNCGLRSAELRALKIRDIDWRGGRLFVRQGKGMKDRILGLSNEDQLLLRAWLDHKPKSSSSQGSSSELAFTDLTGQKPLCARWLRYFVRRLVQKAGIEKAISVHSLRHSFASDLLRKTRNLIVVQQALGHESVATTQIYCHLNNDEVVEAMRGLRNA